MQTPPPPPGENAAQWFDLLFTAFQYLGNAKSQLKEMFYKMEIKRPLGQIKQSQFSLLLKLKTKTQFMLLIFVPNFHQWWWIWRMQQFINKDRDSSNMTRKFNRQKLQTSHTYLFIFKWGIIIWSIHSIPVLRKCQESIHIVIKCINILFPG